MTGTFCTCLMATLCSHLSWEHSRMSGSRGSNSWAVADQMCAWRPHTVTCSSSTVTSFSHHHTFTSSPRGHLDSQIDFSVLTNRTVSSPMQQYQQPLEVTLTSTKPYLLLYFYSDIGSSGLGINISYW